MKKYICNQRVMYYVLYHHLHSENKPRHMSHDEDGAYGDKDDRVVGLAVVVTAVNVGAGADDGPERIKGDWKT